jgi:hypothetical protein
MIQMKKPKDLQTSFQPDLEPFEEIKQAVFLDK